MTGKSSSGWTGLSALERMAILFTLLVVVLFIGIEAWQLNNSYRQHLATARVDTTNLAKAMAQHATDTFKQADTVLFGLVERVENDGLAPSQIQRLKRVLQAQQAAMPSLHGLFIYDAAGNWVATASGKVPANANNADREYFRYHRDHPDRGAHIGVPITSRSTGELIIPVSRRFDGADGRFAGVVLATFRVSYFSDFYEQFDVDGEGVIVLALDDGTILVRRPFDPGVIGTSLAGGKVFGELLPQAPTGTAVFRSRVDQVERLYSYRRVDDFPLVVEAALSSTAIRAPWLQELWRSASLVGVMLAAMLYLGFSLLRQARISARSTQALRQARDALEHLAMQDGLTGLANRRHFDATLSQEVNRARRNGRPVGLVMIDIDYFKRFNDRYGHPAGDACLQAVAQAIAGVAVRAGDLVARYGGEEIVVLLADADQKGAMALAEKACRAVQSLGIPHEASPHGVVTVSIGVQSGLCLDENAGRQLVQQADQALYQAKAGGRNQVRSPDAS